MKTKKIVCLILGVIVAFSLTGCSDMVGALLWPYIFSQKAVYSQYRTYENFNTYKPDFEAIKSVVEEIGEGGYSMSERKGTLSKRHDTEDGEVHYIDIDLTDSERQSIKNIVENSYVSSFYIISYQNKDGVKYVFFLEEQGCGVVCTDNIERFVEVCNPKLEYRYNRLAEDWYAVYY